MGDADPVWLRRHEELASCGSFAIAIRAVDDDQRHAGAYFRDSKNVLALLHLAFHHDQRVGVPSTQYRWVEIVEIDSAMGNYLASVCRRVAERAESPTFGFGRARIDRATGSFEQEGVRRGVTCATFLLALLASHGIDLVDLDSWQARSEDAEWQAQIVRLIEAGDSPDRHEHAQTIRADVGQCVRIRPEEVAAAAACSPLPADYVTVEPRGRQIVLALPTRREG